eukprot:TRINITY_DN1916_c0_g1_i1.p1 TRINITY_DN1916_c0_g1~~TRINITY_DN1916_c0_g1_i1.p1  ORF type:complete len:318 (+),score=77.82 TRINITY_DN1916_c0_g1_i1:109-1062(+)
MTLHEFARAFQSPCCFHVLHDAFPHSISMLRTLPFSSSNVGRVADALHSTSFLKKSFPHTRRNSDCLFITKDNSRRYCWPDDEFSYRKPWWSLDEEEEEEDYSESDEEFEDTEGYYRLSWGEAVVQQVFRSFNWILPAAVMTFLIGNPMAILMALLIPFAQSMLVTLFQQMVRGLFNAFETNTEEPLQKPKKSSYRKRTGVKTRYSEASADDYNEEFKSSGNYKNGKMPNLSNDMSSVGEQTISWAYSEEARKDTTSGIKLGGWEDLENDTPLKQRSSKRKKMGGKLSNKIRRKETPLLLRLLIALFPFLGFWERYI